MNKNPRRFCASMSRGKADLRVVGMRIETPSPALRLVRNFPFAIVLVTHNLPLATSVCDRIAVLNRGRKVADVATAETDNDHLVGWITGSRASMFS